MTVMHGPGSRKIIDLVLPGSGTRLPCLAGATSALSMAGFLPRRVAGTSGGGILALLIALGRGNEARKLCDDFLTGDLLDLSLWPFDRYGLYKGDKIRALLGKVFGNARMGDARIPCRVVVCNLWTRQAEVIDSTNPKHKHLLMADVAACTSAIPLFFKARRIDPKVEHLYVDGGTSLNLAAGTFDDDESAPTVALCFADDRSTELKPVKSLADYATALFNLRQDASNTALPALKSRHHYVEIHTQADGMKFDLSPQEIASRWSEGELAVKKNIVALMQLMNH